MSFVDTLVADAARMVAQNPELRFGQAMWNIAHDKKPDVVRPLVGTEYDPFYDNSRVNDFIVKLRELIKDG